MNEKYMVYCSKVYDFLMRSIWFICAYRLMENGRKRKYSEKFGRKRTETHETYDCRFGMLYLCSMKATTNNMTNSTSSQQTMILIWGGRADWAAVFQTPSRTARVLGTRKFSVSTFFSAPSAPKKMEGDGVTDDDGFSKTPCVPQVCARI